MELLTPTPPQVNAVALALAAILIVLFIRALRSPGIHRLRRFTAFTMVLGASLPILNILLILAGFTLFLTDLSPIPPHLLHGLVQHLPFLFFMISAVLLLHPKAPRYALQVELTWGVILVVNVSIFLLVLYQLVTWTPPPPLPPVPVPDGDVHFSRERMALKMILPICWTVISAVAMYKAFTDRRQNPATSAAS
jgi:hypothetical protein